MLAHIDQLAAAYLRLREAQGRRDPDGIDTALGVLLPLLGLPARRPWPSG